jgi:hypothetical protein
LGDAQSVNALLELWRGIIGTCRSREVWGAVLACLLWCIWRERNNCTFEGVELSLPDLKFLILKCLYDWCSNPSVFYIFLYGLHWCSVCHSIISVLFLFDFRLIVGPFVLYSSWCILLVYLVGSFFSVIFNVPARYLHSVQHFM